MDADDARAMGQRFFKDRFYHGVKIISDKMTSIVVDGTPAYEWEGIIELHGAFSVSGMRRLNSRYAFKMVLDATKDGIMNWELN
jgi:hypothetical protein